MRLALVSASLLSTLVACGSDVPGDQDLYGEGYGTPENPVPAQAASKGPYMVDTTMQFTVEQLLPGRIAAIVEAMRTFETDPAKALLDLAEAQGVPAVGTIRDALPGFLEDRLGGWINDEIQRFEVGGRPITAYVGDVAELAEYSLTQFEIESQMAIDLYETTHTLTALDLTPTGFDIRIPIEGLAADILTQHPTIALGEGGNITFSDQTFGLQYGTYAWTGLNAISTHVFGQDIRATLGKAVNCDSLAEKIADKCALGACVGHETEIRAICNGGLDGLVNFTKGKFTALDINAFQFAAGQARLVDVDADGIGDRIEGGVWDAKMNIGMGLRHAPATFIGTREGSGLD